MRHRSTCPTGSHAGDLLRPIATPCARAQSTGEAYDRAVYGASDEVSGTWAEQAGATNDRTSLDGDDAPLEVRGAWARETVEADKRAGGSGWAPAQRKVAAREYIAATLVRGSARMASVLPRGEASVQQLGRPRTAAHAPPAHQFY